MFDPPRWLSMHSQGPITLNSSEYHFYPSQSNGNQKLTVYQQQTEGQLHPMTMYFDIEPINTFIRSDKGDTSELKTWKKQENSKDHHLIEKIIIEQDSLVRESEWIRKYEPTKFYELLTDELHNRNSLIWLKSWDPIVFNKHIKKIQPVKSIFSAQKTFNKQYTLPTQYSYKKLLLLSGPPGCGKTTLARVIARHCGYSYVQINASDDRSGKVLITKIQSLVKNQTLRSDQKPVCVIIDEVDGALDTDSNGMREVLHYIQTGETGNQKKRKDKGKEKGKPDEKKEKPSSFKSKYQNNKYSRDKPVVEEERRTSLNRPIIFICNDPFVKGLKELRSKAHVIYFNTLNEERVVKRLKEITDKQKVFIENDILIKIAQMSNNDVRSAVGLLQLICNRKRKEGITAKQMINRMKLSYTKDSNASINEFLHQLFQTQNKATINQKIFKEYSKFIYQTDNVSLLNETFFHNMMYKSFFRRTTSMTQLYDQIRSMDVVSRQNFHYNNELTYAFSFPFVFYKINFKNEQYKKIEFPSAFFERLNKLKANKAIVQKTLHGLPSSVAYHINFRRLIEEYLTTLYYALQATSSKEEQVMRCVFKMISYGLELANRSSQHLFNPQIDALLTFHDKKPEIILSNSARLMMEEGYQYAKFKNTLLADIEPNLKSESMGLGKSKKKKFQSDEGVVKYKFLEGTGTEVKYDLKIGFFFNQKMIQ